MDMGIFININYNLVSYLLNEPLACFQYNVVSEQNYRYITTIKLAFVQNAHKQLEYNHSPLGSRHAEEWQMLILE